MTPELSLRTELNQTVPDYISILRRLREIWGTVLTDEKLNPYYDKTEEIAVMFDYGYPIRLCTPEGSVPIIGSGFSHPFEFYMKGLAEAFDVQIITPQRDDVETRKRSEVEYQCGYSGPLVAIKEKDSASPQERISQG